MKPGWRDYLEWKGQIIKHISLGSKGGGSSISECSESFCLSHSCSLVVTSSRTKWQAIEGISWTLIWDLLSKICGSSYRLSILNFHSSGEDFEYTFQKYPRYLYIYFFKLNLYLKIYIFFSLFCSIYKFEWQTDLWSAAFYTHKLFTWISIILPLIPVWI